MATRRSHKKSRNGCEQCKRRRVKCDEDNPCKNCSRRGMECTFDSRGSLTPPDRPNETGILVDLRDRMLASEQPGEAADPFRVFNERIERGAFFPQEWTGQDFELMHHYTMYTCKTIARRPDIQETWQEAIPKIAYSYEFLMHGILAFSALHLAHLKPERHSYYLASSGFHMTLGLRSFRRILLSPTNDNCCALFAFCSFIMVYISASPTEPAEPDLGDGLDSIIELLGLCRGTLVLAPYLERIQTTPLKPLFLSEFYADVSSPTGSGYQFDGLEEHLAHLHQLIQSNISDSISAESYLRALDRLKASFETIRCFELPLEIGLLYIWPLSIDEPFFNELKQRHPVALVFLATYSVQLHAFSDYWFVGQQGFAWLSRISAVLPGEFHEFLTWPRLYSSQDPIP
ncbi:hypothetical protein ASPVEDRAFT_142123 [Aspergillus versicolor CBS 583.65]|uniref:Zn(2)-C6 fungal-type domain-containing protein n=1 Tax=Aspergillus versicolor CBS 583.65 TaxID=1036611 RepID=A0A1L9Q1Q6_ASPVE|nr:uncharacterized protein ASPVEDRAFT_142123 [Aspergillus versicolor CBS 583.65]OJJ07717.1 hypothetical protein ASPVEDRAFT_142123 [Aspergillus versicolor CBS 583.65]